MLRPVLLRDSGGPPATTLLRQPSKRRQRPAERSRAGHSCRLLPCFSPCAGSERQGDQAGAAPGKRREPLPHSTGRNLLRHSVLRQKDRNGDLSAARSSSELRGEPEWPRAHGRAAHAVPGRPAPRTKTSLCSSASAREALPPPWWELPRRWRALGHGAEGGAAGIAPELQVPAVPSGGGGQCLAGSSRDGEGMSKPVLEAVSCSWGQVATKGGLVLKPSRDLYKERAAPPAPRGRSPSAVVGRHQLSHALPDVHRLDLLRLQAVVAGPDG